MKSSLQLNLGHQITLTPQLQQAIRLLQLSTTDLQQEIQEQLESNPMLEVTANEEKDDLKDDYDSALQSKHEMDDFQWSNLYGHQNQHNIYNENAYIYETLHCTTTTLQEHLRWQCDLTPMSDIDKAIAITIIDAINEDGFLTVTLDDLHTSLTSPQVPIEMDEIEAVLHLIHQMDPIGCGATSLMETLLIQLKTMSASTPCLRLAENIIKDNIELLGHHNYRQLMKLYKVDATTLEHALHLIQVLNPKPGSVINPKAPEYIIPDLTMRKINNRWEVMLNQNVLPNLGINSQYASLVKKVNNEADHLFLKSNLQEARWFLKSIQSRQETLLKVAQYIVDYQQEYFNFGDEAMKPLVLNEVAHALNMHESTISRVTTQKFMYTPHGLFELKYFFSSHVSTATGGECSSTAIRALIKKLIAAENRQKPLSDSKLTQLIGMQGIQIARRTVAKYREAMGISTSSERKTIRS
jgi:RNA polymerase sigma-54 factor